MDPVPTPAQAEKLQINSNIDAGLAVYRRPEGGTAEGWKESPNVIQIIPSLTTKVSNGYPELFREGTEMGKEEVVRLFFQKEDFTADPNELFKQVAKLLGAAQTASREDPEFAQEIIESVQRKYAVMQHAWRAQTNKEFCEARGLRGLENPVIQFGNPALQMASQKWEGTSEELLAQVEAFNRAHAGQTGLHESAKKTSILGACQVMPQEQFATKRPPAMISMALPGEKFGKSVVLVNPHVTELQFAEGKHATNGWYGYFGGRIYDQLPEVLAIECKLFDYESQQLVDGKVEFKDGKISFYEGQEKKREVAMNAADPSIMLLILDLLEGKTPFDRFKEMPKPFDPAQVKDRSAVKGPGYFDDLAHYYGAGKDKDTQTARNSAAVNGRHLFPVTPVMAETVTTEVRVNEGPTVPVPPRVRGFDVYYPGYGPRLISKVEKTELEAERLSREVRSQVEQI